MDCEAEMSDKIEKLKNEILEQIETDQIVLPTLPEIALKAKDIAEDPDSNAKQLAEAINQDPAMAARIIKVANSPMFRTSNELENVQGAIMRLGVTQVANLVSGLAMKQMFQATTDGVDKLLRRTWQSSLQISGVASVLCKNFTKLKPDYAMLAGLTHQIGTLPILSYAEETGDISDLISLQKVVNQIHPIIGEKILSHWDFPQEICIIPKNYLDFDRGEPSDAVDYIDIITVANIEVYLSTHPDSKDKIDVEKINSYHRLGILEDEGFTEDQMNEASSTMQSMNM